MRNCRYIVGNEILTENEFLSYLENQKDILNFFDQSVLLHEVIHPFIDSLQAEFPKELSAVYKSFLTTKEGKETLKFVQENYPHLTPQELEREVLTRGVQRTIHLKPKSWVTRLLNLIKKLLGIQKEISLNSSIKDLADFIENDYVPQSTPIESFRQRNIKPLDPVQDSIQKIENHIKEYQDWRPDGNVYRNSLGLTAMRATRFVQEVMMKDTPYSYNEQEIIKSNAFNEFKKLINKLSGGRLIQNPTWAMIAAFIQQGNVTRAQLLNAINESKELQELIRRSNERAINKIINEILPQIWFIKTDPSKLQKAINFLKTGKGLTEEEASELNSLLPVFDASPIDYYNKVISSEEPVKIASAIWTALEQKYAEEMNWKSKVALVGTVVHKIMENIAKQYQGKTVEQPVDLIKVSDEGIKELLGDLYDKERAEYERIKAEMVSVFNEQIYPLIKGKRVYSEVKLAQSVELDGKPVLIMGTCDLFVINPDGTHFIIDYKSSLKPSELWNMGKIQAVNSQMLLYSKMAEKIGIAPQPGKVGYSINLPLNLSANNFEPRENKIKTLAGIEIKRKFKNEPLLKPERRNPAQDFKLNQQFGLADKKNIYTKQNILPIRQFLKTYFNWELEDSVVVSDEDIEKQVRYLKSSKVKFYINKFTGKKIYNPYYEPKNEKDNPFKTAEARQKAMETYEKNLREYVRQYLPIERNQPVNLVGFIEAMQEYEFQQRFGLEKIVKAPRLADLEGWNNKQLNTLHPVLRKYWNQFVTIGSRIEPVWENISTAESLAVGIILMRNRVSGLIEVVNLSQNDLNERLQLNYTKHRRFIKSWVASDSIGGNFLDGEKDAQAMLMRADWGNVESIKVYLYLANNPQLGQIGSIVTISPTKDSPPVIKRLTELDREVKKLIKLTPEVSIDLRKTIEQYNAYQHKTGADAEFVELINFYQEHISEAFGETGYRQTAIEELKKYKPKDPNVNFLDENRVSLKESLHQIYQRQQQLRNKINLSESEQQELIIISRIILAAENIEVYADEADIEQMTVQFVQPDEQRSPLFKKVRDLVLKARTAIKREYNKTFDNVRDVFRKYYNEVGRFRTIINPREIYQNLFEYDIDEQGNVYNTLRLRDPDSETYDYKQFGQTALTSAEKEFLRGVIKELKRLKQSHLQSNAGIFRKDDMDRFYRELPIVGRNQLSRFAELIGKGDPKEALLAMRTSIENAFVKQQSSRKDANDNSGFKTKFYTFLNAQTSLDSRTQQIIELGDNIETNVETLLFLASYNINRENEFNKVLPLIAAIRNLINLSSYSWFKNYPELLNLLDTYVNNNVFGRTGIRDEQEEYARLVNKIKTGVTLFQLGYNIRTSAMQLTTSMLSTITAFAGQGSHLLSKSGFIDGLKIAISPLEKHQEFIHLLNSHYDISNINPESLLYDRRISKSIGNYLSTSMMWMNAIPDMIFRRAMWISQAVKDGVIKFENGDISKDSAIRVENGKLIYDPTKDERYKDYFTKGPKYEEHKALYEAKVIRAKKEGTIDPETGYPMYAYDSRELEAKQKIISDTYADISSENKTWFERTIIGMLWIQFKRFMLSKKNQYITRWEDPVKETRTGQYKILMIDGKPALNENGEPIEYWEGHLHEGILNTLIKVAVKIANEPLRVLKQGLELSDFQKRNLKHFASDVALTLATMLLAYGLAYDDEDEKDKSFLESIAVFLYHAHRDSTIFAILNDVSVNSPFVAFSIIKRFAAGVFGGILNGKPEESLEAVLRGVGVTRSGLNIYEFVSGNKVFD
ncbi:MAG: PD-(D/E)XK nuclease family protein [Candidatus Dojkabacteria bacterium]|nr:PD-(D/E)XK nuclease family protein [Candidatus Dojkabacteria bacterium]